MGTYGKITSDMLTDMAAIKFLPLTPATALSSSIPDFNAAVAHSGVNVAVFPYRVKIISCQLLVCTAIASGTPDFSLGISGAANAIVNTYSLATNPAGTVYTPALVTVGYVLPANTPIIATTVVDSATGIYKAWIGYKIDVETDIVS